MTRRALLVLATAASLCGCDPIARGGAEHASGGRLEPWAGSYRQLFDDEINPAALGLSFDGGSPSADPLLRHRVLSADVVARMRVQTMTRDVIGETVRYRLGVQVGVPTLLPAQIDDLVFELAIRPETAAFGVVSSMENALRGRTFIGFVRRFAGADEPEIHWHLTADTAEVALAIQRIGAFEDLNRK